MPLIQLTSFGVKHISFAPNLPIGIIASAKAFFSSISATAGFGSFRPYNRMKEESTSQEYRMILLNSGCFLVARKVTSKSVGSSAGGSSFTGSGSGSGSCAGSGSGAGGDAGFSSSSGSFLYSIASTA
jgi:hypothetical protein